MSRGHFVSAATSSATAVTAAAPMSQRVHVGPNPARCSKTMPQAAATRTIAIAADLLNTAASPISAPAAGARAMV